MSYLRSLILVTFCMGLFVQSVPAETEKEVSWREQYAYSLGMAAYPYVYPYFHMAKVRWMWTTQKRDPVHTPYMAINHFWYATVITSAEYKDGGTPNNDILYAAAWVFVGDEPVILSHPDMGERYFTFQLTGFDSDNFAYVGQRATGSKAGHYAIVSKDFEGELPEGVTALPAATTPWVLVAGRTRVGDAEDLRKVVALEKQYRLTPLSYWGKPLEDLPASHEIWAPFDPKQDPLANWRSINRAMTENPPPAYESALVKFIAEVNIGPGQDLDALDEDSKRGLARAAKDAHQWMITARNDIPGGTMVNGWRRNPEEAGRMGVDGLYLVRGVHQSFKGIATNFREEAKYFAAARDIDNVHLDASKSSYELTFAAGEEPPANEFWSLTMYGLDTNLVANPIDRYSLSPQSSDLERNKDGSLTIYVQYESPGKDKESNWLPAPDGRFMISLRIYDPKEEVLVDGTGTWMPPVITVIKK